MSAMPEYVRQEIDLDPEDWNEFSSVTHDAVDEIVTYLSTVRERPVWQPPPNDVIERLRSKLPENPSPLRNVFEQFKRDVLPYPTGNIHPRFWSWVSGTGNATGVLADMLAAGMNSLNLGFDNSAPVRVELQVLEWFRTLFGFPAETSGLFVSGGSMGNLVGLAVARTARAGYDVRKLGVNPPGQPRLVVYTSTEAHSSVQKAVEIMGMGADGLRHLPVNSDYQIDVDALHTQIHRDLNDGLKPIAIVASAGAVNTGALDPLNKLADIAQEHDLWLHVDGAFGALAAVVEEKPDDLVGLERADSIAFDFHKWLHQTYNAGCVLIKNESAHRDTFTLNPSYLTKLDAGVAAGPINFSALGIQLSRSFAALRVWMSIKTLGFGKFRKVIEQNIEQARYLNDLVENNAKLELLAPTTLNIVNYRFNPGELSESQLETLNQRLLVALQVQGIAAPSSTQLKGKFSIRVSITNHRSRREDFDLLVRESLRIGGELLTGINQDA
ncbi:MAG: aminotransferase class V-fold PLP-dependent enzyme [Gammaproteobacteria bacterium]